MKHRSVTTLLLTALTISALVAAGCGGSDKPASSENGDAQGSAPTAQSGKPAASDPKQAVENFIQAQIKGDAATACAAMTEQYKKKTYGDDCEATVKQFGKESSSYLIKDTIKISAAKVDDDSATVQMKATINNPQTKRPEQVKTTFKLEKVDDAWKLAGDDAASSSSN